MTTQRAQSKNVGSCNACDKQITEAGARNAPVTVISLYRSSFRLCDDCLAELRVKLTEALADTQQEAGL